MLNGKQHGRRIKAVRPLKSPWLVAVFSNGLRMFDPRPQVKEERTGGVERTRMSPRRGSWCSRRTDRVSGLSLAQPLHQSHSSRSGFITGPILRCCCLPEYAQVIKMLGNGRLEAMCFDGTKRLCHIRGKLRKKVGTSRPAPSGSHKTHTHTHFWQHTHRETHPDVTLTVRFPPLSVSC